MTRWIVLATACLVPPRLAAQDGSTARAFCDPGDPANRCPGVDCRCTEDVLAIRFDRSGGPILAIDDEPGLPIEAVVVLETKSMGVQGWSYGVRHDGRALTILSATTDGTDAGDIFRNHFIVMKFDGVADCTSDPGPRCPPGSGFISAALSSFAGNPTLPVGSNTLARLTYRLETSAAASGEAGVLLELTESLAANSNSPPASINLTIIGRWGRPKTLVDGKILVSSRAFHRGDPDGDGRLSVADAIALLHLLFLAGPAPGCLDAGDFDDDGRIDTTDPVLILRWLFLGGSAPAPPGAPPAPCGPDPEGSGSSLGCDAYPGC